MVFCREELYKSIQAGLSCLRVCRISLQDVACILQIVHGMHDLPQEHHLTKFRIGRHPKHICELTVIPGIRVLFTCRFKRWNEFLERLQEKEQKRFCEIRILLIQFQRKQTQDTAVAVPDLQLQRIRDFRVKYVRFPGQPFRSNIQYP